MEFDQASSTYDHDFTNTITGKSQRHQVWSYLNPTLTSGQTLDILEINCGTGIDAIHCASFGHNILATDISEGMLEKANLNTKNHDFSGSIRIKKLDVQDLNSLPKESQFDVILSNFGGLNCISKAALKTFSKNCKVHLKNGGKLHFIVMPQACVWESIYFLLRIKPKEIFRRKRVVLANVSGIKVKTWYHSPREIRQIFEHSFNVRVIKPIGLFTYPSYMEHIARKYKNIYKGLIFLEKTCARYSWQAYLSDHYYIEMELR